MGDHLRKRRMDLGLLQREVAERLGVAKDTYRFWECNRARPLPRQWEGIIRFLGYRPSSLGDSLIRKSTDRTSRQTRILPPLP
ncbi:MAG: helix-turn-helix transcriptional regulator [Candidatus Eisenbacteria bacterium]